MKNKPSYSAYSRLLGSNKEAPDTVNIGAAEKNNIVDLTLRLRAKRPLEESLHTGVRMSHAEFEEMHGATDDDIATVESFAHQFNLTICESHNGKRSVALSGRVVDVEAAFQVCLSLYRDRNGCIYRGRAGHIHLPEELQDIIEGVFGLDDRPHARPRFKMAGKDDRIVAHAVQQGYTPTEVADIYGFPKEVNGTGQCIGIIELGGGYRSNDLQQYFTGLKIPMPNVVAISVDGGNNFPTISNSADGEVMLDIEVAGAIAPGARLAVYFAPNTDKGFLDAITNAIHDTRNKPSVLSISWGSAERTWTQQSLNSYNEIFKTASLLGITICVASGDNGSEDGVNDGLTHVDFPASSPYVLACGGTKLLASGTDIISEMAWHEPGGSATGGGVSDFFSVPAYQAQANVPVSVNNGFKGRGVPDVAGNADATTGYKVQVDGEQLVIGGTSAVAPLFAALIALINQKKGTNAGFINPMLYANPTLCRDITQGDNVTTYTGKGYMSQKGWDPCTGLGVLKELQIV